MPHALDRLRETAFRKQLHGQVGSARSLRGGRANPHPDTLLRAELDDRALRSRRAAAERLGRPQPKLGQWHGRGTASKKAAAPRSASARVI
jgi:hypothetical protein